MATAERGATGGLAALGAPLYTVIVGLGDVSLFAAQMLGWMARHRPFARTLLPALYSVGVRSVPVIAITGMFIGMVLAVQSYGEFHMIGLATHLGGIINISVVRELGPVLAATMLAGRVGSAMAAELATMRVTEQIDALSCLGSNPLHYLVVPRLLACVLLIPLLCVVADVTGIAGGALVTVRVFHVDAHFYWRNGQGYVDAWDIFTGMVKAMTFGAAISLIACYRGFHNDAGAEGVGRSATRSFVASFIAILVLDFFLALLLNGLRPLLWAHRTRAL